MLMFLQILAYSGNLHLGRAFFGYLTDEVQQTILGPQGDVMPGGDILAACTALCLVFWRNCKFACYVLNIPPLTPQ